MIIIKGKDCKIGMKVRYICHESDHFDKDEILTIKSFSFYDIFFENCIVEFEEKNTVTDSLNIDKPVSKFKIGDKVVWSGDKLEVFGLHFEKNREEFEYALNAIDKNYRILEYESKLSLLKKKDQLKPGDKFISFSDKEKDKIIVLAKEYDYIRSEVRYFGKNEEYGFVDVWGIDDIKEIVYD